MATTTPRPLARFAAVLVATAAWATLSHAADATDAAPAGPDIWTAAATGDFKVLKAYREGGGSLDSLQPEFGFTPLISAVAANNLDVIDWLLANGADVNARAGDGETALIAATFLGYADAAERLLDKGADISARDDTGSTASAMLDLDWQTTSTVAQQLQLDLDRQEVEAGREAIAVRMAKDDIWIAVVIDDADAVRSHLADTDVNKRDPDSGTTLLGIAAALGYAEVAAMLLDAGADVNGRDYASGSTPLHGAAFFGRAEVVELLLAKGAKVDAMSDDGGTPLSVAELNWPTTEFIAGLLDVPVEKQTVMAGKAKAAELLRAKQ